MLLPPLTCLFSATPLISCLTATARPWLNGFLAMSEVEAAAAVEVMSMDDRAEVELEAGSVSGSMSAVDVLQPISGNAGVQIHLTPRRVSHICPGERAPCMPFDCV